MGDTRVAVSDGGSLIMNIFGFKDNWMKGNNITVPEADAKITEIEINPDVQDDIFPHSQISWKVVLPHLTGEVVKKVEVLSDIAGRIKIAVEEDQLLHVRWYPPKGIDASFASWTREDRETLRTPDNLKAARIKQILVDDSELTFRPKAGTQKTQVEVVSWGALFRFNKRLRTKAASMVLSFEKAREKV